MGYAELVKLEGSARFVFLRKPPGSYPQTDSSVFALLTDVTIIFATDADFRVDARTDTTDIEVMRPPPGADGTLLTMEVMVTPREGPEEVLSVSSGEVMRVRRGARMVYLRRQRDDVNDNLTHIKRLLGDSAQDPPRGGRHP